MTALVWSGLALAILGAFAAALRLNWARVRPYAPVVTTRWRRDEEAEEYARQVRQMASWAREAERAHAAKRQAERLLVLLSEPLKDWDLLDFPSIPGNSLNQRPATLSYEHAQHLKRVLDAYRLTSAELARIRMGAKVGDKARQRGWDDVALAVTGDDREALRRIARGPLP